VKLTQDGFRVKEVLRMELAICRGLSFNLFGEEPMAFIDRFILAAQKENDHKFRELCMFFLDVIVSFLIQLDLYYFKGRYIIKLSFYDNIYSWNVLFKWDLLSITF
jgi:uncharacterized membrane protein (GlpM family)